MSDNAPTLHMHTRLWRVLALVVVALPIFAAFLVSRKLFVFFPASLVLLGPLARAIAWPALIPAVIGAFIAWPLIAIGVFVDAPPGSLLWLVLIGACGLILFLPVALMLSPTDRQSFGAFLSGIVPESPASLAAKGFPLIAQTSTREMEDGTAYTVAWTDFAKLRYVHGDRLIFFPMAALVVFVGSRMPGGGHDDLMNTLLAVSIGLAILSCFFWGQRLYHQRSRYAGRAVSFLPNGNIVINNPPALDANKKSDGPSRLIESGMQRLVSIEYGRTTDWQTLHKAYVYEPADWYDVFMLFDADTRFCVGRNFGSREHAHQVAGELNVLKSRLKPSPVQRPKQGRIID